MAPTSTDKTTEKPEAKKAEAAPPEDAFTVERVLAEPEAITGYQRHIVAGAFCGVPLTDSVTAKQAKAQIKKWLGTDVQSSTDSED